MCCIHVLSCHLLHLIHVSSQIVLTGYPGGRDKINASSTDYYRLLFFHGYNPQNAPQNRLNPPAINIFFQPPDWDIKVNTLSCIVSEMGQFVCYFNEVQNYNVFTKLCLCLCVRLCIITSSNDVLLSQVHADPEQLVDGTQVRIYGWVEYKIWPHRQKHYHSVKVVYYEKRIGEPTTSVYSLLG